MELVDLGQHAMAATAIMHLVNVLQPMILKTDDSKKFTPLLAILLAVVYFMTPMSGIEGADGAAADMTTKVITGVIFGISLIGGRDAMKNMKGDYSNTPGA